MDNNEDFRSMGCLHVPRISITDGKAKRVKTIYFITLSIVFFISTVLMIKYLPGTTFLIGITGAILLSIFIYDKLKLMDCAHHLLSSVGETTKNILIHVTFLMSAFVFFTSIKSIAEGALILQVYYSAWIMLSASMYYLYYLDYLKKCDARRELNRILNSGNYNFHGQLSEILSRIHTDAGIGVNVLDTPEPNVSEAAFTAQPISHRSETTTNTLSSGESSRTPSRHIRRPRRRYPQSPSSPEMAAWNQASIDLLRSTLMVSVNEDTLQTSQAQDPPTQHLQLNTSGMSPIPEPSRSRHSQLNVSGTSPIQDSSRSRHSQVYVSGTSPIPESSRSRHSQLNVSGTSPIPESSRSRHSQLNVSGTSPIQDPSRSRHSQLNVSGTSPIPDPSRSRHSQVYVSETSPIPDPSRFRHSQLYVSGTSPIPESSRSRHSQVYVSGTSLIPDPSMSKHSTNVNNENVAPRQRRSQGNLAKTSPLSAAVDVSSGSRISSAQNDDKLPPKRSPHLLRY